jgi:hypothetical protein
MAQQHQESVLVWFQLVDSTGSPFKGALKTSVIRASLAAPVLDLFRKAVKAEYADSHLKGVAPSDLIVYENKAAFDQRMPLEEETVLDEVGASRNQALIVLVPAPFTTSRFPFFHSIMDACISDDESWLDLAHEIPSTYLKKLYIRECYRDIAASIDVPGINKAVVTGTPGIGKSLFLIFLLWKLVKERKPVLFIYHPFTIYFDGKGGVFTLESMPSLSDASFWNETLWCLFDAKYKSEADLGKLPVGLCSFVVSTSPRREILNDFKKFPVPSIFYMPTWTENELEAISQLFPNSNDWHERFEILGGIPRSVLEYQGQSATEILEAACKACSLDDCIKEVGLHSTITEKSNIIHSLIHIKSERPFMRSSVCYASQAALDMIVRRKGNEARLRMNDLLASCQGNPLTAALCGYIFEPYAIQLLEKGGVFSCRELVHGNKKYKPAETTLHILPSQKKTVDRVLPGQILNQLYVPKTTNYAAVDAWIPGVGAFQMTVGKKHDIKDSAKSDLEKLGKNSMKLYWLLPPLYYSNFTKKAAAQEIVQYAVLIPYPHPQ